VPGVPDAAGRAGRGVAVGVAVAVAVAVGLGLVFVLGLVCDRDACRAVAER
jgi:hypothetical protein